MHITAARINWRNRLSGGTCSSISSMIADETSSIAMVRRYSAGVQATDVTRDKYRKYLSCHELS